MIWFNLCEWENWYTETTNTSTQDEGESEFIASTDISNIKLLAECIINQKTNEL